MAESLLLELARRVGEETLQFDLPESNTAAVTLARKHGMTEVFGCAKMTLGPPPWLPWHEIFGVTTFELG